MKNGMQDLNNHLFAQLERLGEEGISPETLKMEVARSKAMTSVASVLSRNAALELKAEKLHSDGLLNQKPPMLKPKKLVLGGGDK